MKRQYKDENGNIVLAYSGHGIIAVPRDFKAEDAIPITKEEWKAFEEAEKNAEPPRDLAKELDDLKAENDLLKGKLDEVKTNVDKLKKP